MELIPCARLYIVLFLHQTTTYECSFSYNDRLYIVLFLHQTTTFRLMLLYFLLLYIVLFLHQTTTLQRSYCSGYALYIVLFLHQTTTSRVYYFLALCCISYYSYIKPQLWLIHLISVLVVYRTIPTSNHNWLRLCYYFWLLYIVLFLHQTTTVGGLFGISACCISYYSYIKPQLSIVILAWIIVVYRTIPTSNHNCNNPYLVSTSLYIVLFLHQTTTYTMIGNPSSCCISYYSYIKPQLQVCYFLFIAVVYRTIPTSNHNARPLLGAIGWVVYRTIPTSNHNSHLVARTASALYIVLFLHQTTTYNVDIADNQHITITFINKK